MRKLVIAAALSLSLASVAAAQNVIYVDADATGADNGSSWTDAYTDLQSALAAAVSGDEVWVAEGTYVPGTDKADSFVVSVDISLYGGFDGTETGLGQRDWRARETVLSGDVLGNDGPGYENYEENAYHVLRVTSDAVLDGFTVTGGNADDYGLPDNSGGGISMPWACSPVVRNCTLRGNLARSRGGAMYAAAANPVFERCVFRENSASSGGAAYNDSSTWSARYESCLFAWNTARSGGAVSVPFGRPSFLNCTFCWNSAEAEGGGVDHGSSATATIANCIFWGNTAYRDPEISDGDTPATVTYSLLQSARAGEGNIQGYPVFGDPWSGDFRLAAGSPCIDAGDGDVAPATDIDGNIRHDDTGTPDTGSGSVTYADMGAHEFQGTTPESRLVVYEPGRGDLLKVGTTADVSWVSSANVPTVDIEVSRDNGVSWKSIAAAEGNDGSYVWTVSDGGAPLPQRQCMIRVSSTSGTGPAGTSPVFRVFSGVWHVDWRAPAGGDGLSWDQAFQHPNEVLDAIRSGEEAWIGQGVYLPGTEVADTFRITVGAALYGGFAGTETERGQRDPAAYATVLSGDVNGDDTPDFANCEDNIANVVTIEESAAGATLDGLTISGGHARLPGGSSAGGAIYAHEVPDLTVQNCTIERNAKRSTYPGGGAYFIDCPNAQVRDCVFRDNDGDATRGTALAVSGDGSICERCVFESNVFGAAVPSIRECTFINNGTGLLGSGTVLDCRFTGNFYGIHMNGTRGVLIEDCVFEGNDNTSPNPGSGAMLFNVSGTIRGCTFDGNEGSALCLNLGEDQTVANCQFIGNGAGIYTSNSSPIVTDCTFTNNGRGMICWKDSPQVSACTFTGNSASAGAAVYVLLSDPAITGCTFIDNHATEDGGAIFFEAKDVVGAVVEDCFFSGNRAEGDGGAFANYGASPAITGCIFVGNSAVDAGGALANYSRYPGMGHIPSSPVVTSCVFADNVAELGGAISNSSGGSEHSSPEYRNCVLAGNEATNGGAVYNENSDAVFVNCTSSSNLSSLKGGSMYNTSSNPAVTNCILCDRSLEEHPGVYDDQDSTTTIASSLVGGSPVFANSTDPDGSDAVWRTADDGLRLQATSPCIDAGNTAALPPGLTTDLTRQPRVQGDSVDMGAYEFVPTNPPVADAQATPMLGVAPLDVHFSATGSYDPDGTIEAYDWRIAGESVADTAEFDRTFYNTTDQVVVYSVVLTVTDDKAATGTATVDVDVDPPVDSDGDGMPDYWETQHESYGFDPGLWNDPDADTDGDGYSDLQEYKAGTDPTDPLSKPSSSGGGTSSTGGCAPGASGGVELVLVVAALACTGRRTAARRRGSPAAPA